MCAMCWAGNPGDGTIANGGACGRPFTPACKNECLPKLPLKNIAQTDHGYHATTTSNIISWSYTVAEVCTDTIDVTDVDNGSTAKVCNVGNL